VRGKDGLADDRPGWMSRARRRPEATVRASALILECEWGVSGLDFIGSPLSGCILVDEARN
jgi:hypothetical protein